MPSSFMEAATAAPPAPSELNEAPVQPSGGQPVEVIPPSPKPEPVKTETKAEPPKEKTSAKTSAKKEEATTEAPEAKTSATSEPKKDEKASETKAAPTAEQIEEEDLSKEEVAKIGKMTPAELRAVFAARNRAERKVRKLEPENEKLQKEVKRIATLEATIAELEKRPTTEANDARIKAAEDELGKRKGELDAREAQAKDREEQVRLREYATEVKKTPDYQKYVSGPTKKMTEELSLLCRGATENDEKAGGLYNQIIGALGIDDPAVRWREVKKAIADADPADKAAFRKIYDDWAMILQNEKQLNENAEVAKKTVEEHRNASSVAETKARISRFQAADTHIRKELEKEVPFLTMDLSNFPHYQKLRDEWDKQRTDFLKEIESGNVTPETIAALHEMAGSYQLAKIVSRDYQIQLQKGMDDLQKQFDKVKAELEEIRSKEKKAKDEETEEERAADEVTPKISEGTDGSRTTPVQPGRFPAGTTVGKGFAATVMEAKDT